MTWTRVAVTADGSADGYGPWYALNARGPVGDTWVSFCRAQACSKREPCVMWTEAKVSG